MENKKVIKNFIFNAAYNLIATAIPVSLLQIIILPWVARYIPADDYGLAVTIIALLNICPGVLGMALNNVRLLNDKGEGDNPNKHNFPGLVRELCVVNVVAMTALTIAYEKQFNLSVILTVFLSVLWLLREYLIVEFQIKLQYQNILINNIILSAGYLLGFGVFHFTVQWQLIYIVGYAAAIIDLYLKGSFAKEKFNKTKYLMHIRKDTYFLSLSAVLTRITTYADKLILYPILGGELVSVYYAASIMAKLVSMVINPITSVFLTYLSKVQKRPRRLFKIAFAVSVAICAVGYVLIIVISKFVLTILYPEFVTAALELVPYTAMATILYVLITIVNPLILKFFDMKWQIVINAINTVLYVSVSFVCLKLGGIKWFCIGIIIVNAVKLLTMLVLYTTGKEKPEEGSAETELSKN